jgi:CxxC motif-containing protein (DUF1111 family)
MSYKAAAMCSAIVMSTLFYNAAQAADQQVERGKYLVATGGCHDCHTPGYFLSHEQTDKLEGRTSPSLYQDLVYSGHRT